LWLKDLGNERLVEEYSAGGAPLRVEVTLEKDETAFSGYRWTSGKGPGISIFSGTPCSATIIVGEKRPIDYVIPVFKNLLSDG
jgi:HlyD family secretion protein